MSEKIKWGILSTGHISGKFTNALKTLPEAEIIAVASRDTGTAKKFAEKYGIPKAYGSYSALAKELLVTISRVLKNMILVRLGPELKHMAPCDSGLGIIINFTIRFKLIQ